MQVPVRTDLADFRAHVDAFRLDLEVRNRAQATVFIYTDAAERFAVFLADNDLPTAVQAITRAHVESFIRHLLATRAGNTALNRYKSLQQFFNFLEREEVIERSPMAKMTQPTVRDDNPPAVLDMESIRALLKATDGSAFTPRRDRALLMVLLDTGLRRGEAAGLQLTDVDLRQRTLRVVGKGGKMRIVPLGARAAQSVSRYLLRRKEHRFAFRPELWLSRDGPLTGWGISSVVERLARDAGVPPVHVHQFRHSFAHFWRLNGGDDDSLMRLAGWSSREMLNRYGRSVGDARARELHAKLSLGDRL